jgi:hypothetical protein
MQILSEIFGTQRNVKVLSQNALSKSAKLSLA